VKTILIVVFDLRFGTLCLFLEVNMNQDFCLFFGLCEKQRERKDWDFGTNMAGFFSPSLLLKIQHCLSRSFGSKQSCSISYSPDISPADFFLFL
jgi:hypothetical protein